MSKIIFSITFCVIVFIFSTVEAFGCTCMGISRPVENEYKGKGAIFSGKVTKIVKNDRMSSSVTIKVANSWKGKVAKTITISTNASSSLCGYTFTKGKSYLIYAFVEGNEIFTSLCSRTMLLSDAGEDIEILNNLSAKKEPKTKSSPK